MRSIRLGVLALGGLLLSSCMTVTLAKYDGTVDPSRLGAWDRCAIAKDSEEFRAGTVVCCYCYQPNTLRLQAAIDRAGTRFIIEGCLHCRGYRFCRPADPGASLFVP